MEVYQDADGEEEYYEGEEGVAAEEEYEYEEEEGCYNGEGEDDGYAEGEDIQFGAEPKQKKRRKILGDDVTDLSGETQRARSAEDVRSAQAGLVQHDATKATFDHKGRLLLNPTKDGRFPEEPFWLAAKIAQKLKPHQIAGLRRATPFTCAKL